MELNVYQTDAEAFEATAERVAAIVGTGAGMASIALAGGRGGRGVMGALAGRTDLGWDRTDWFFGDERCVPPDDPQSNVRLARESLFRPRGIKDARIHPPAPAADAATMAAAYATVLRDRLGALPVFDVILLGIGMNGHTASLMPGCAALGSTDPVAAVSREEATEAPHVARITVTPPVLRAARHVLVTVTGDAKAEIVARVLRDPDDPTRLPAQLVRPGGTVEWIIDRAAAAVLLRDARPADAQ
jgi:6-phosphogluconolactonase